MGLDICFVADKKSELVAELVQTMSVRVVTHTDSIEIVLLHENKISQHGFLRDSLPAPGVVFMEIRARDNARNII